MEKRTDFIIHNHKISVLRLDTIHPFVNGNKPFKLKYFTAAALAQQKSIIATAGGAYSSHILATAAWCFENKMASIGFIRGVEPPALSATLKQAKAFGMALQFVPKQQYKKFLEAPKLPENVYFIPEGGFGKLGAKGICEHIKSIPNLAEYGYILTACGTGTTLAGIVQAAYAYQTIIGINVLKNEGLQQAVKSLLAPSTAENWTILNDFHWGGYAKKNAELIDWMNYFFETYQLPTDFVYTAKALYALEKLCAENYFLPHKKILFIHTGGLQGNSTIQKSLVFS